MIIALIIVIIFLIILCIFAFNNRKKINTDIIKKNDELQKQSQEILDYKEQCELQLNNVKRDLNNIQSSYNKETKEYENLVHEKDKVKIILESLSNQESQTRERIVELSKSAAAVADEQKELVQNAFTEWCESLDKDYIAKEEYYKNLISLLEHSYDARQGELMRESGKIREELDNLKKARSAAIEAARREKEIKENSSFYCIEITDEDKADIARLETVAKTLNKPRVLHMLVWQTYYQKPLKSLSANILGAKIVTGIYKITNIITNECYIGQAVDIASRFAEHCKCGLGIDTPAGNKLYKAMQEYGLYNFAFECLEECDLKHLNERERNYIEFYQSYEFGYNSNAGIKK